MFGIAKRLSSLCKMQLGASYCPGSSITLSITAPAKRAANGYQRRAILNSFNGSSESESPPPRICRRSRGIQHDAQFERVSRHFVHRWRKRSSRFKALIDDSPLRGLLRKVFLRATSRDPILREGRIETISVSNPRSRARRFMIAC